MAAFNGVGPRLQLQLLCGRRRASCSHLLFGAVAERSRGVGLRPARASACVKVERTNTRVYSNRHAHTKTHAYMRTCAGTRARSHPTHRQYTCSPLAYEACVWCKQHKAAEDSKARHSRTCACAHASPWTCTSK
uniref:Uncharacterized protein n=1 Tax=Chrysotila carterae TaxID=13221 RepID=A0A6T0C2Q8_CHRCT